MIDINYKWAQWSTNVNTFGMNWQTYHDGMWYDKTVISYDEAVEEIKKEVTAKVMKDHPHLIAFKTSVDEVIQVKEVSFDLRHNDIVLPQNGTVPPLKLASSEKINKGTIEEQSLKLPKRNYIDQTITEINGCMELNGDAGLMSYQIVSKTNERIKEAFEKKFKELHPN